MLNTLAKLREEREEGEKGFTLIELLVVVVIIGVLVAIAIPLYLNYRKGAENKDAQSDVRNAIGAIENCYADNSNKYPTGTVTNAGPGGVINLTCKTDGSGTATSGATATGDQVINISDGDYVTYTPGTGSYTVSAHYGGTADGTTHKTYTYSSSTGKTVTS